MKNKFKNYSFWISVAGAVVLLLNNLGKVFGFSVDNEAIFSIVDGVCGVLVVFGVLTMNKNNQKTNQSGGEQAQSDKAESHDGLTEQFDADKTDDVQNPEQNNQPAKQTETSAIQTETSAKQVKTSAEQNKNK